MNRTSLTLVLVAATFATVGCTSKNYVRQETTPLINKTNELDDLTAKNSKEIKDVDARTQAAIQAVQAKATISMRKRWLPERAPTKPRPPQTMLSTAWIPFECRSQPG